MSINVTVNGNPICVRRTRMVLSDLEQIKKNERDKKRRLRLEQVRQQSKEISCKLLERAKNLAKKELNRLNNDGKSELKKMHENKIMEIQRKYQEDMEDIGTAHSAAARQPDVEAIIQADRYNGRIVAAERGKEAMQRLKESAQKEDPVAIQQERLRQVREVENVRSAMVAKLSSKPLVTDLGTAPESAHEEETVETVVRTAQHTSPKKKKSKKLVSKKSPGKVVSKSNIKVVSQQQKLKSPRQVVVEVHRAASKSPKRPSPRGRTNGNSAADSPSKAQTICKNPSVAPEIECSNPRCNRDTDDQEPRRTVPTIKLTPSKADKVARYNPEDYKQKTSDSNGSSSSSVSDDSSYFSDGCSVLILPKTPTPKHHTSPMGGSKVQLYDHSTRHRNSYEQPVGTVERMNIRNAPNAEEAAREVMKSESIASSLAENRRLIAQKRGEDAILRERVRRDYEAMMKNLDHFTREERKLKATQPQCCTSEHMSQSRRKECQNDRQRKMDRAFENAMRDTNHAGSSRPEDLVERVITIEPRAKPERATNFPEATWQNPPFFESSRAPSDVRQDDAEEMSREEHILEMLKKVERQKRLLLREFCAELPNTILSASMTPLLDNRETAATERSVPQPPPPTAHAAPSPEIKIINMSSSDEHVKKPTKTVKKKATKKSKSPPPAPPLTTIETAVQTSRLDEIGASRDKSTQVEIVSEESKSSSPKSDTVAPEPLQYVEPLVTVITPNVGDSSSSSDTRVAGIIIEVDDKQVKVAPKKRKSSSEKSSKRGSSRSRSKPRSLPASTASSPVKRSVTSAPSSRAGSPKKADAASSTHSRSPEKVVDIVINKNNVKVQAGPSRHAKVAVDSSIESSPLHSTPEAQEVFTGKTYRIFKPATFKKVRDTRDASDTSTSYASVIGPKRGSALPARHQITPILEMLDSSANESVRISRRNVSPVSTPETPSPRVMNIPTNIPHPERIGRILRYESFNETTRAEDSTLPDSTQHEPSTSTDQSFLHNVDRRPVKGPRVAAIRRSSNPSDYCSCANPTCDRMHANAVEIRDYAMSTNNPEVLTKYEDLQNVCTERIASLTELIRRVRNEQSGMDLSTINPADETSHMQFPPPRPPRSDLLSVQRLVESIEAIHCQLAKTLQESQNIITNNVVPTLQASVNPEVPTSSTSYETKSKGSASTSTEETPVAVVTAKAKPKVISNVPVQVDLDQLKRVRGPYTAMIMSTENVALPAPGNSCRHEEIVEKLSQEILEQSKSVEGSREKDASNEDGERSLSRQRTPSPPQNLSNARMQTSPPKKDDDEVTRDVRKSPEPKSEEDFVPVLAGIPKVPRVLPNLLGARPRPPPAYGAYRNDMGSPRHELSTIVEFDTPDTANRSQGSTRSPTGKSRRLLQLPSPAKSTTSASSSVEKNANTQTVPVKPSVHVAPLISQNMSRTIPRRLNMRDAASPDEKFVCQSPLDRAQSEKATTKSLLSQGPRTPLEGASASRKDDAARSDDLMTSSRAERDARQLQDRYENSAERHCALASSTLNPDSENKNEKITSTSSNSFSGLSGISEIVSTSTSELAKWASSSEEIETALKKMGLGWAVATLKKTREASALSSSSNSDVTPMNTARRNKSPSKKQANDLNMCGLPELSDVSSISIKEASKSTERAVLMKARTSTPNIQNSNSSSGKSSSTTNSSSGVSLQDPSDSLTAPNLSLTNKR